MFDRRSVGEKLDKEFIRVRKGSINILKTSAEMVKLTDTDYNYICINLISQIAQTAVS